MKKNYAEVSDSVIYGEIIGSLTDVAGCNIGSYMKRRLLIRGISQVLIGIFKY